MDRISGRSRASAPGKKIRSKSDGAWKTKSLPTTPFLTGVFEKENLQAIIDGVLTNKRQRARRVRTTLKTSSKVKEN